MARRQNDRLRIALYEQPRWLPSERRMRRDARRYAGLVEFVSENIGFLGVIIALGGYFLHSDALFLASCFPLGFDAWRRRAWAFVSLNVIWGALALTRLLT